jgi:hypothetical protein
MGWPLSYLYQRESAVRCRAWVNFYYVDGRPIYNRGEMIGRWSESRIPINDLDQYNPWLVENEFDISPDTHATLDIAFKYPHEDKCYGYNNENYDHQKYPEYRSSWVIDKGQYLIRVRVKVGEQVFSNVFRLVNEMDFRVEEIEDKNLKNRIK